MNKKLIRLTESDLHKIVKESVNKVLNEISYNMAQRAYNASQDLNRPMSAAMQRKMQNNPYAKAQQMSNLKQGASNSFNRDYGYNLKNVPYGSGGDDNMDVADKSKPYYGGRNMYGSNGNYFHEFAGRGYEGDDNAEQMYYRRTQQKDWGNGGDPYTNQEMSFKNKMANPMLANAIRKGNNAVDMAHRNQQ